jgi:hypothetical protein
MAVCIPERSKNIWDFDPLSLGRCVLWLDSADRNTLFTDVAGTTPVSGGSPQVVAHWKDKSPSQANVTSASAGPSYTFSSQFGGLTFASTKTLTGTPPPFSSSGLCAFVVFNPTSPLTRTRMFRIFSGTYLASMDTTAIDIMIPSVYNYQLNLRGLPAVNNLYSVMSYGPNQTELNINFGHSLSFWEYSASSYTGTVLEVGATTFVGTVSEIIVYDTFLTVQDKRTIEGYLAQKWRVTANTDVPPTTGRLVWYDADDPARFTGGTTWLDKSGNNNHGINGTAGITTMPTRTIWSNGRTAARFISTSKNSMKTTNAITNFVSYFVVARFTRAVGYGFIMINNLDGQRQIVVNSTSFPMDLFWAPGGTGINTGGFVRDQGFLFCGTVTSGSGIAYINGVQAGSNTNPSTSGTSQNYFGSANGDGGYLTIDIAEILIYTGVVSLANRQTIERYLIQKWGLNFQLPPRHPFFRISPHLRNFQPIDFNSCQLWLDAADASSITLSGTNVTQWNDKSGNAYIFTQTTSGFQPTYSTASLNGLNTITFTSANTTYLVGTASTNFMRTNSLSVYGVFRTNDQNSGASVFAKSLAGGAAGRILYGVRDSGTPGLINSGIGTSGSNAYANNVSDTYTAGAWRVHGFVSDRSGWTTTLFQNGSLIATTTITADTTTNLTTAFPMLVGAYNNSSGGANPPQAGYYLNGGIAEILVFNSALTTSQREEVESYLANKWGLNPIYGANTPLMVPGLALWLDAADSSTVTGTTAVTQWNDKSGGGYNFTQPTSSRRPTYDATNRQMIFVGNNTQNSDANQALQNTSIPFAGTSYSIFIVAKGNASQPSFTGYNYMLAPCVVFPNTRLAFASLSGNFATFTGSGTTWNDLNANTPTISVRTSTRIWCMIVSDSTLTPFYDGISMNTKTGTTGSFTGLNVGDAFSTDSGQCWNGSINEILVFSTALTTTQRQTIEGYLSNKWGLTTLNRFLPSISYKYIAPPSTAPFLPTSIAGCQLWLDGNDPLGTGSQPANAAAVSTWADKSGRGMNGTAVGTTPTFDSTRRAISFGGANHYSLPDNTYPTGNSSYTYFIIVTFTVINGGGILGGGSFTGSDSIGFRNNSGLGFYAYWFGNDIYSATTYVANQISSLVHFYTTGGRRTLIQNFTTTTSNIPTTPRNQGATNNAVGRTFGSEWMTGFIHEVIVYDTELTTIQRKQVEGYLAQKWNIPLVTVMTTVLPDFGCNLWLDGRNPLGLGFAINDGTAISSWTDRSGNSFNLTQATVANQPIYSNNLITFSNNRYLTIPTAVMNNCGVWSIYLVINPISSTNWIMAKQKDGSNTYNILSMTKNTNSSGNTVTGTTGTLYWRSFNAGGQLASTASVTGTTLQLFTIIFDGTNVLFYKNGLLEKTTAGSFATSNDVTSISNYTLGAWLVGGVISDTGVTNFQLGEMIIYSRDTTIQRPEIEAYLINRWGLNNITTATVYDPHPYRTLPPAQNGDVTFSYLPITQPAIIATARTYLPLATNTTDIGTAPVSVTVNGSVPFGTIGGRRCAVFNNSLSNYLSFPYINSTNFTICFWYRPLDSAAYYTVASITNSGFDPALQVDIVNSPTGVTVSVMIPNKWTVSRNFGSSGAGLWYHIAITVNQSTFAVQIYFQGNFTASGTGSSPSAISSRNLFVLGRSGDNGRAFNGYVNQFMFFNSILSATDIFNIFYST